VFYCAFKPCHENSLLFVEGCFNSFHQNRSGITFSSKGPVEIDTQFVGAEVS
jgi:hypothetical protein